MTAPISRYPRVVPSRLMEDRPDWQSRVFNDAILPLYPNTKGVMIPFKDISAVMTEWNNTSRREAKFEVYVATKPDAAASSFALRPEDSQPPVGIAYEVARYNTKEGMLEEAAKLAQRIGVRVIHL